MEFLNLIRGGVGWGAKRPETADTRRAEFVDLGGVGWGGWWGRGVGVLNDQKQQTLEGRHSWISMGWDGEMGQSPMYLGGEVGGGGGHVCVCVGGGGAE